MCLFSLELPANSPLSFSFQSIIWAEVGLTCHASSKQACEDLVPKPSPALLGRRLACSDLTAFAVVMAGQLPAPVAFVFITVTESLAFLRFLPQYLPNNSFKYAVGCAVLVNPVLCGVYKLYIHPYFVSPLRHLPGPKV